MTVRVTWLLESMARLQHERAVILCGSEAAYAAALREVELLRMPERIEVRLVTGIQGFRANEMIGDGIEPTQVIDSLKMRLHMPEPTPADNHRRKSKGERKRERRWRNDR